MTIVVYPGTFDPFTCGHRDIIERAQQLFTRVIVGVASSARKTPFLTLSERLLLTKAALSDLERVQVEPLDGLLVDFTVAHQAQCILRGLRSGTDFDYESALSNMNHALNADLQTVFLAASPAVAAISSTMVREIYSLGGDISLFVPKNIADFLQSKR